MSDATHARRVARSLWRMVRLVELGAPSALVVNDVSISMRKALRDIGGVTDEVAEIMTALIVEEFKKLRDAEPPAPKTKGKRKSKRT